MTVRLTHRTENKIRKARNAYVPVSEKPASSNITADVSDDMLAKMLEDAQSIRTNRRSTLRSMPTCPGTPLTQEQQEILRRVRRPMDSIEIGELLGVKTYAASNKMGALRTRGYYTSHMQKRVNVWTPTDKLLNGEEDQ